MFESYYVAFLAIFPYLFPALKGELNIKHEKDSETFKNIRK